MKFCSMLFLIIFSLSCRHIKLKDTPLETAEPTAEDIEESPPPLKTALFISDGGLYTFLALPVLDFFSSNKVPIDTVAGAGFGAWVAAFYAKNESTSELKWNLFKMQKKGLFNKKGFFKGDKTSQILEDNIKEVFAGGLKLNFICPALTSGGKRKWFTARSPASYSLLSCLNHLPPLFFKFKNTSSKASLFSAKNIFKHLKSQGMDVIVWIKPSFQSAHLTKAGLAPDYAFLFWSERALYLEDQDLFENVIVFSLPPVSIPVDDFSHIDKMIKMPLSFSVKKQFSKLKERLNL